MNPGFAEFLKASPQDRRDVFLGEAARLGTPEQNVERDFWVSDYIRPAVKIESGAKSALDSHEEMSIVPYISGAVPRLALAAQGVTTVVAERHLWCHEPFMAHVHFSPISRHTGRD
jgi:hypothetical protein